MSRTKKIAAAMSTSALLLVAVPAGVALGQSPEDCYPLDECETPTTVVSESETVGTPPEVGTPTVTVVADEETLPRTGIDTGLLVAAAGGALVIGGGLVVGSRRRSRG